MSRAPCCQVRSEPVAAGARFQTLADWLAWQETLHPSRIDLRLERVGAVWQRLHPELKPGRLPCAVITVAGTNGKGSCVAYLEAWYRAAGYCCGAYTSPHLLRYNERVRINAEMAADEDLCAAFARIDQVRADASLTYFEFGTLAAFDLFVRAGVEIALLEVGLGGRLDAVNIIDADVALVASIGFDHCSWLGDTLDQIAFEKAGIFRAGQPAVIGQRDAPARLRERAEEVGALPMQLGREFDWSAEVGQWAWRGPLSKQHGALPAPALRGRRQFDNAAASLCALEQLSDRFPVSLVAIRQGLLRVKLEGRFRVLPGRPTWVLDVAHNDKAALTLAENLASYPCAGRRLAVLSLLADKDARAVIAPLAPLIEGWHIGRSTSERAMALEDLAAALADVAPAVGCLAHPDLEQAFAAAAAQAEPDDLILVFGSFVTVEAALRSPIIAAV
ncbi:MAG: bifunctional tetrahydrofolate synthase/dihydrofolate synthase [Lamprobacter sp.]|uniref:bifunctional tetrahydrofolate synthase/dihydrofolate synthase n=1 Tax=Lamprobacter sp. TaxID=3100796 RepID=UPI002B256675|nr:bifunctional tetrahydrofolate synthase/dihydrofolate synthase [Lamprobacter sp.]MEA3639435.1 bifunctional tetrahydrofolate synthase/dihydrofolate synthase [Lamprobacter sp.]